MMDRLPITDDPIRCRYEDCPEQHPVSPDDDGIDVQPVTCPTCRADLGLPPLDEDYAYR